MTDEKVIEVARRYKRMLDGYGLMRESTHAKLIEMPAQIVAFIHAGRREKAMRWLGFIQGVFWAEGVYTLDELKEHSKP